MLPAESATVGTLRCLGRRSGQSHRNDEVQIRECTPTLVEPQSVAGEELVRNRETDVVERDLVDQSAIRSIEQRYSREAGGTPEAERLAQEVESQAGVDHVFDDQDVATLERCVDVLQETDGSVAPTGVGGELDHVERMRNPELPCQVREKHHARLQRRDEDRIEPRVVPRDLDTELPDASRDLGPGEIDNADLAVVRSIVGRHRLRGQTQAIALRETLDVSTVEELDPDVGIQPLNLAELLVLACDQRLLHHGHLDEEVLLGEVEVGRECTHHPPFLIALEDERVRLVIPGYSVVVKNLGALDFDAIRESRRLCSTICLENAAFDPHLCQGSSGLGRPATAS